MKFTSLYKLSEKDKEEILRKILPDKPPEEVMTVNKEMWQEFMDYVDAQETKINDLKRRVDYLVQMSQYQYKQYESLRKELLSKIENSVEGLKETVSKDDNINSVISEQPKKDEKPALNQEAEKSLWSSSAAEEQLSAKPKTVKKFDRSKFEPLVDGEKEVREIPESWEDIIASIDDGTYREKYKIGNFKPLDLGSEGIIRMQIAAFDADLLEDYSGRAAITWIAMDLLKTEHRMNPDAEQGKIGASIFCGWKESEMRAYLDLRIKSLIPPIIRNSIKLIKKYSLSINKKGSYILNEETDDYLWIPSVGEVFSNGECYKYNSKLSNLRENKLFYKSLFSCDNDRVRNDGDWWLRSASYTGCFSLVNWFGSNENTNASKLSGVALGFCT